MLWKILITGLLTASSVSAQDTPFVLEGTWTARVGPERVLRGTWSGQAVPGTANEARGSWTMLGDGNRILVRGTWSARKAARGWEGAWSARIQSERPSSGRSSSDRVVSGSWQAALDETKGTLAELLTKTLESQVAGSWQSGRLEGFWWVQGGRRTKG